MDYHFEKLTQEHLILLLEWLNSPHVQQFWDTGTVWTVDLVKEKYGSYIEGYKPVNGKRYAMQAFIIYHGMHPIGYIQAYDVLDYERDDYNLQDILKETSFCNSHLGAIDLYIADTAYVGRGVGSTVIRQFLKEFIWKDFEGCLVDPDNINPRAIRAYEKAGFIKIAETDDRKVSIMVATNKS